MRIGSVEVPVVVALAPMAGVSGYAMRSLVRSLGEVYTVCEMASAKALYHQDKKTLPLLRIGEDEHPSAIQLFGSEPECMALAARKAIEISKADIIDINMGCPTPKITKNGDGCALMRDPGKAAAVAGAVCRSVNVPVTVKMRLGWDSGSINAPELAKRLEQEGVSALTIHARTRTQMYSGNADWQGICAVMRAVSIPVIANGDIFTPEAALSCKRQTGAEMYMVGRGAFGAPWILSRISAVLNGKSDPGEPGAAERFRIAERCFELLLEDKGERAACLEMRKHLAWFTRGLRGAAVYRQAVMTLQEPGQVRALIAEMSRWYERSADI